MATYPSNQTTPVKGSGNYLWNWLGTPLKKFAEALQPYVGGGDKLVAGSRELTLNSSGQLTLNNGNLTIISPNLDVRLQAQDDVTIQAQDRVAIEAQDSIGIRAKQTIEIYNLSQDFDSGNQGTNIELVAGRGADGNLANAGTGGNVRIYAGNAGTSASGSGDAGGSILIEAGFTTQTSQPGGDVDIIAGNSVDGESGVVSITGNFEWKFRTNNAALLFPTVPLTTLPNPLGLPGARGVIDDSTVAASGNFGAIAVGGGSNTVPVFSDGTNWLIG
jgi:hypothetical protein